MSGEILRRGFAGTLSYFGSRAEVTLDGTWSLTFQEANKVLAAKSADPPREIEIVEGDGSWESRTVLVFPAPPAVEVKAKGTIFNVRTATKEVWLLPLPNLGEGQSTLRVENIHEAARAYADMVEIEIVSFEGGPNLVRRVKK